MSQALASDFLDRPFAWLAGLPAMNLPMRDRLYGFILTWRAAILAATICSLVLWIGADLQTDQRWPLWFAAADVLLCWCKWRVISSDRLHTPEARARAVGWLMALGLAWALLLGIGVMLVMFTGKPALTYLAIGVGAGTMAVATFRNAPAPRHATLLVLCIVVPAGIGAFWGPDPTLRLLGVGLFPFSFALFAMVRQNFGVMLSAAEAQEQLHAAARTDALTGLANRLRFNERMAELVVEPDAEKLAILYLDLDGFKRVNDRHGHEAGDKLLAQVSERLRSVVRETDCIFRLGGDEFALILTGARAEQVDAIAARLLDALSAQFEVVPGVVLEVGTSIGSAERRSPGASAESLLRAADAALYAAKAAGRGRHVHSLDLTPALG